VPNYYDGFGLVITPSFLLKRFSAKKPHFLRGKLAAKQNRLSSPYYNNGESQRDYMTDFLRFFTYFFVILFKHRFVEMFLADLSQNISSIYDMRRFFNL